MATEQFRTTISLVLWTTTTEDAQSEIDAIKAAVPEADRDNVLSTIEFVASGKPAPPPEPDPIPETDE